MPRRTSLNAPIDPLKAIQKGLLRRGELPLHAVMSKQSPKETPQPELSGGRSEKKRVEHDPKKIKKAQEEAKQTEALHELADKSNDVLFKAETVFPFVLFPDTIILDRMQLSIVNRQFFKMAKITGIRVEDILSAEITVGPFFGSVKIVSRFYSYQMAADATVAEEQQKAPTINFLWKKDALELHKLLQGYIVVTHENIDCSDIPKDELIKLLHTLGENEVIR